MFPTHPLRRGSGTRKLEIAPPLAFLPLDKPGGLWKLETGNCPQPRNGQVQLPAGSWKLEIALRSGSQRRKLEAGNWKADLRYEINYKKTILIRGHALAVSSLSFGSVGIRNAEFHLPELFQRWKLEAGKWRQKPSEAAPPPSVRKQQERPPPLLPSPKRQCHQVVSATPAARRPWPPDVLALAAQ
jgi:hypothetical protein